MASSDSAALHRLRAGIVIPAHPLALTAERRLDERRQRALTRYYCAAGAGGLAVGVHTTQFAIRDPSVGLLRPVLALAAETMTACERAGAEPLVRIAGVCGGTSQAVAEVGLARELGYHAGLLSLAALKGQPTEAVLAHVRRVGEVLPLVGFYLQPAVGGLLLDYAFWRAFVETEAVVAIKIAPFNRYHTLDVVRAVADSGRRDIALYTGNDDNIAADLVTGFSLGDGPPLHFAGGLLGQWAVWTRKAVELLAEAHRSRRDPARLPDLLALGTRLTDANAALFDVAHDFAGCIAGLHEVLRQQGLLAGRWCLAAGEDLSPGQLEEIRRVCAAYPELTDDAFVAEHRDEWLA